VKYKDILTTGDVATICKCSHDTVKRWLERGHLPGHRLTPQGQWRILPQDIVEFMERRGLPMGERARVILGLPELAVKDFVYCWEFHVRNKTHPGKEERRCEDCLVFKTKAKECYVLRDQADPSLFLCPGPCEECEYYRFLTEMHLPGGGPEA